VTVDTGNPNAIDLSLEKFGFKIRYRLRHYAQAQHRQAWKVSVPHFASVCASAIEAD
jgi:hypothetical protein